LKPTKHEMRIGLDIAINNWGEPCKPKCRCEDCRHIYYLRDDVAQALADYRVDILTGINMEY